MFVLLYISLALVFCTTECVPIRTRHWSGYSSPFGSALYRPIPAICTGHIPNTLMFQGFIQPFFSYDMSMGRCHIVYGVTVRSGAPNVFGSADVNELAAQRRSAKEAPQGEVMFINRMNT
uniref:Secreted protein n=1 Tax=Steinernema glaseri TaxID=37863 RepID=A0A1I7XY49_9BILA